MKTNEKLSFNLDLKNRSNLTNVYDQNERLLFIYIFFIVFNFFLNFILFNLKTNIYTLHDESVYPQTLLRFMTFFKKKNSYEKKLKSLHSQVQ